MRNRARFRLAQPRLTVAEYHGKLADPEFRRKRASNASKAAHGLDARIAAIVRRAGDLTPEQIETLRGLLAAPADGPKT
jgi:hypothetical protein